MSDQSKRRFAVSDTALTGLRLVERLPRRDDRGSLTRLFAGAELRDAGWTLPVAEINHTITRRAGTVRGLHFQVPPFREAKLVMCIRGAVWDVVVDLRHETATPRWHAQELSAENQYGLLIPEGCAHGFQTLTDDCEMIYLHSTPYSAPHERGLNPLDPGLGIPWPREITDISERDRSHAMLAIRTDLR